MAVGIVHSARMASSYDTTRKSWNLLPWFHDQTVALIIWPTQTGIWLMPRYDTTDCDMSWMLCSRSMHSESAIELLCSCCLRCVCICCSTRLSGLQFASVELSLLLNWDFHHTEKTISIIFRTDFWLRAFIKQILSTWLSAKCSPIRVIHVYAYEWKLWLGVLCTWALRRVLNVCRMDGNDLKGFEF